MRGSSSRPSPRSCVTRAPTKPFLSVCDWVWPEPIGSGHTFITNAHHGRKSPQPRGNSQLLEPREQGPSQHLAASTTAPLPPLSHTSEPAQRGSRRPPHPFADHAVKLAHCTSNRFTLHDSVHTAAAHQSQGSLTPTHKSTICHPHHREPSHPHSVLCGLHHSLHNPF